MSVVVYAESPNGKIKKAALEAVSYGAKLAQAMGTECTALVIGAAEGKEELASYGAAKILQLEHEHLNSFDSQNFAFAIAEVAKTQNASVLVLSHSASGKSVAGRVAVRLNGALVSGVNALPNLEGGFSVAKGVFSGKATAHYHVNADIKVLSLMGNAVPLEKQEAAGAVEAIQLDIPAPKTKVLEVKTQDGVVPLPEAELVVSAGRGMKGPGNWGIIDELAQILGATTACSRPVADIGWRPHHEHVGQTGVAIRPNLYIAIGISGAIQHLAGVNSSKTIVVINKDPEAPFFKAADYGVQADLFDVVPKLIEALKKYKASQN